MQFSSDLLTRFQISINSKKIMLKFFVLVIALVCVLNMSVVRETRYDYNLTIMKSPKPATDTIYPHIKF